jgi:hypothetical protein
VHGGVCKKHLRDMQMRHMYLPLGCSLFWTLILGMPFCMLRYPVDFLVGIVVCAARIHLGPSVEKPGDQRLCS